MTNHVHLLLTPASGESVARLIMSLGRRYVQYINRRYRRTVSVRSAPLYRRFRELTDYAEVKGACVEYVSDTAQLRIAER